MDGESTMSFVLGITPAAPPMTIRGNRVGRCTGQPRLAFSTASARIRRRRTAAVLCHVLAREPGTFLSLFIGSVLALGVRRWIKQMNQTVG